VVADRLSLRWYLEYDLGERLPDHSSLTRIRDRYGLATFRRFFEAVVEQCQAAGLVWGRGVRAYSSRRSRSSARSRARTQASRSSRSSPSAISTP
jgi:hypothetical protein